MDAFERRPQASPLGRKLSEYRERVPLARCWRAVRVLDYRAGPSPLRPLRALSLS
jgi:hypothetical protein